MTKEVTPLNGDYEAVGTQRVNRLRKKIVLLYEFLVFVAFLNKMEKKWARIRVRLGLGKV